MAKRKAHDVRTMCKILGIAPSEYYYQRNKKKRKENQSKWRETEVAYRGPNE